MTSYKQDQKIGRELLRKLGYELLAQPLTEAMMAVEQPVTEGDVRSAIEETIKRVFLEDTDWQIVLDAVAAHCDPEDVF